MHVLLLPFSPHAFYVDHNVFVFVCLFIRLFVFRLSKFQNNMPEHCFFCEKIQKWFTITCWINFLILAIKWPLLLKQKIVTPIQIVLSVKSDHFSKKHTLKKVLQKHVILSEINVRSVDIKNILSKHIL